MQIKQRVKKQSDDFKVTFVIKDSKKFNLVRSFRHFLMKGKKFLEYFIKNNYIYYPV